MTQLAKRKTRLQFETSDTVRGRAVILEATPYTVALRLKGTRTRYEISYAGIYYAAAKLAADRARAEKRARRSKANA